MNDDNGHIKYPPGKHPNSLSNLDSYKPGQSGNPAGPPKGFIRITDKIKKILESEVPELSNEFDHIKQLIVSKGHPRTLTVLEVLSAVAVYKALHGNFKYFKLVMDRVDGPIAKRIEGELTTVTDIDRMSDEELAQLAKTIKQKRLSIELEQRSIDSGISD